MDDTNVNAFETLSRYGKLRLKMLHTYRSRDSDIRDSQVADDFDCSVTSVSHIDPDPSSSRNRVFAVESVIPATCVNIFLFIYL